MSLRRVCVALAANNHKRMTNKQLTVASVRFSETPRPHREKYRSCSFASDAAGQTHPEHRRCLRVNANAHAQCVRARDSCV